MSWEIFDDKYGRQVVWEPFIRVRPDGKARLNAAIKRKLEPAAQILIDRCGRKFAFRRCARGDSSSYQLESIETIINLKEVFAELDFKVNTSRRLHGKWAEDELGNQMVEFSLAGERL